MAVDHNSDETFGLPVDEPFTGEQAETIKASDLVKLQETLSAAPVDGPFTADEIITIATYDAPLKELPDDLELPIPSEEWVALVTRN